MTKPLKLLIITAVFLVFTRPAAATTLSPAIIHAELAPGESAAYELRLYNETESEIFLNGYIEKFIPRGERGEVTILPPEVSDRAVTWLKLPVNSLVLAPGEGLTVPLLVEAPLTADVGGYYLAVMWETAPGPVAPQNQTLISSRVGTLLLLKVKGELDNSLEIVDFNLTAGRTFYDRWPVTFSARLRNTGNVHQRPTGAIIIKDFLGRTVETTAFNPASGAILPKTVRIFDSFWGEADKGGWSIISGQLTNFALGRFSAKALISYGDGQSLESAAVYFWVVPWQLLTMAVAILAAIVYAGRKVKRKR